MRSCDSEIDYIYNRIIMRKSTQISVIKKVTLVFVAIISMHIAQASFFGSGNNNNNKKQKKVKQTVVFFKTLNFNSVKANFDFHSFRTYSFKPTQQVSFMRYDRNNTTYIYPYKHKTASSYQKIQLPGPSLKSVIHP
jgi:hypothetical protein